MNAHLVFGISGAAPTGFGVAPPGRHRQILDQHSESPGKIPSSDLSHLFELLEFFGQLGDDLEKVIHNPIIRFLKYRGLRVFVDGYDDL